jgi:hypothetical protein
MDPDPVPDADPDIFVSDLQGVNKKFYFLKKFFCLLLYELKVHLHHFSKIKSHKEVKKQLRINVFLLFFCLMIEGSGSISLTNGSG